MKFKGPYIMVMLAVAALISGCGSKPGVTVVKVCLPGKDISYYTCSLCGSTKAITESGGKRTEQIDYRSPTFARCPHVWQEGVNDFAEPPIADGRIILVKRGKNLGALILRNQQVRPTHADFTWYCRTDGKGTFRKCDAGLFQTSHGSSGRNTSPVQDFSFGPFSVKWSATDAGKGVVAYPKYPEGAMSTSNTLICPTNETDIEKIDATDPKWLYKAYVDDKGRIGTAP